MFLMVVWSHVAFYQSTVVHLPQLQPSTTALLPSDQASRHQTTTVQTLAPDHWTSTSENLSASTTPRNSSITSTMAERRLSKAAAKRVRSDSRIRIESNSVVRTDETEKSEQITMASTDRVTDSGNRTEIEVPRDSLAWIGLRGGARDRGSATNWEMRQSRLLTSADDHSSLFSPATPPSDASLNRLLVSV